MRVLAACSLGGAGHLGPLRPLLDAARRGGHETLVTAPPAMEAMVGATGHAFAPGGEPSEAEVAPIREQLPVVAPEVATVLGNRDLFGRLAARAMVAPLADVLDAWRPDVVLRDPCEYASAVLCAERELPVAQVAISLAEVEWGSIAAAAPALEEHRIGLTEVVRSCTYLTRFPARLDPSPFPATVRMRTDVPPPARTTPVRGRPDRPLVYVSFGTVLGFMSIAAEVFRVVLDAVADLDARVLLTVGRAFDPATLGALPANVHVERWVDQSDVLGEAAAVVCHGGSGTTFGALAAGVPLVVVPQFADQFPNAVAVALAGAGRAVDVTAAGGPRRALAPGDAPAIRKALDAVLSDPSFAVAARAVAADMASAQDVDDVLADLLSLT